MSNNSCDDSSNILSEFRYTERSQITGTETWQETKTSYIFKHYNRSKKYIRDSVQTIDDDATRERLRNKMKP